MAVARVGATPVGAVRRHLALATPAPAAHCGSRLSSPALTMRGVPGPDDTAEGALDAPPGTVVVVGPDGRAAVWRVAADRLPGWPAGEVLGRRAESGRASCRERV